MTICKTGPPCSSADTMPADERVEAESMPWRPVHPTHTIVALVATSVLILAACSGATPDAVETGGGTGPTATSAPNEADREADNGKETLGAATSDNGVDTDDSSDDSAADDGRAGTSGPNAVATDELTDDEKAALALYLMTPEERAVWFSFIQSGGEGTSADGGSPEDGEGPPAVDLDAAPSGDDGPEPAPSPPPAGPPIPPDVLARLSPGAIVVYINSDGTLSDPGVMAGNTGVPAPPVAANSVWDRLAFCESTGNWSINTGNGYHGGLQFDPRTWVSYGGMVYATEAWQASREQQIDIARRVLADVGWGAWPACTLKLGLR